MRTRTSLKLALITTGLLCAISFGIHSYYDRRYLAVLPIMDAPNAALTPAQEEDARCGDWANDWLFLTQVFGAVAAILGIILAWKWLRPKANSVRGFDVIQ